MTDPGTWVAIISLVAGATGSAVTYNQNKAAAATQANIAGHNASLSRAQAQYESESEQLNAQIQRRQLQMEAARREVQAQSLEQGIAVEQRSSRERIAREERQLARQRARQRSLIGASGIVEAGSPVELLAEAAGDTQLALLDISTESENTTRQISSDAEAARFGAAQTGLQARFAGAGEAAARARGASNLRRVNLNESAALATASASSNRANAGLINGIASTASSAYRFQQNGAFTSG